MGSFLPTFLISLMHSSISEQFNALVAILTPTYGAGEAASLANILFEDLLGISRTDRLVAGQELLGNEPLHQIEQASQRLLQMEPIQHIVGFAYFCEHRFQVTPDTLIPRPETEELVHLIAQANDGKKRNILDIGTGTGCIPITLKRLLPACRLTAWDISEQALAVARHNAQNLAVEVNFQLMDALDPITMEQYDVIVSNPPYIPASDQAEMHPNVLDHEPGQALFVPEEDPLLFYREIGKFGRTHLLPGGQLYFEIHERYGLEVQLLLTGQGYQQVSIVKDLNGKDRMLRAVCHHAHGGSSS